MASNVAGPGNRAADPTARAPAGPGAALGAARGAASHPQARAAARAARRGDARRQRADRHLLGLRQRRHARSCTICADERRDGATLVVVESVGDLWALERASATRARYHVLGGALSPLDGVGPDDLNHRRAWSRGSPRAA